MPAPDPIQTSEQEDILASLNALHAEVAELKEVILLLVPCTSQISVIEKAHMIREAHASGNRSAIIKAHKAINGKS